MERAISLVCAVICIFLMAVSFSVWIRCLIYAFKEYGPSDFKKLVVWSGFGWLVVSIV